jgi:hypothetical protein
MRPESRQIEFKKPCCTYAKVCVKGLFPTLNESADCKINSLGDYCLNLKCSYLKWVTTEIISCEDSFLQKIRGLIQGEKNGQG